MRLHAERKPNSCLNLTEHLSPAGVEPKWMNLNQANPTRSCELESQGSLHINSGGSF